MNDKPSPIEERMLDLTAKQMLLQARLETLTNVVGRVFSQNGIKISLHDSDEPGLTFDETIDAEAKRCLQRTLAELEDLSPYLVARMWNIIKDTK